MTHQNTHNVLGRGTHHERKRARLVMLENRGDERV